MGRRDLRPVRIGNYHVAKRIEGASPVLWAVLSLIPMINYVFLFYVGYRVICTVLDRLNDVTRSERRPPRNESPL